MRNEKEELNDLIELMHHTDTNERKKISDAFNLAKKLHSDTKRESGEPYFSHLLETAKILAELGMDSSTVIAGLLHDSIEKKLIKESEVEEEFGKEVVSLINGLNKLSKLKYRGFKQQTESLRKFFIASSSEDIRVLIIRLAERLHNMRTLKYLSREKQIRKSNEVLEIFAPLAYRLGMRVIHKELEDIAFAFIQPKEYHETLELLKKRKKRDMKFLEKFDRSLKKALAKEGITNIKTSFRVKGLYSLYKKIERKNNDIEKIYDITAIRIITDSVTDCYRILGVIHGMWKPLSGRLKDYIALPKPNGYQSIHTTVFTGDGGIVEIQIRTKEMHDVAEKGFASHLSYKGNKVGDALEQMDWLKKMISNTKNKKESIQKDSFYGNRVFVFTPNGDVIDLPENSSPIDFAYAIHTYIGNHISGAKVNGKMSSLDTKLKTGDIIDITTKKTLSPTRKWLEFVTTTEAKRNIKSVLGLTKKN